MVTSYKLQVTCYRLHGSLMDHKILIILFQKVEILTTCNS